MFFAPTFNVRLRSKASRSLIYVSLTSRRGYASPQCDYAFRVRGNADFQKLELTLRNLRSKRVGFAIGPFAFAVYTINNDVVLLPYS